MPGCRPALVDPIHRRYQWAALNGAEGSHVRHGGSRTSPDSWATLKEWPELILERLEGAGVARITLNRPDKRNCWNRPLCHAFLESLDIIRADKELKVVITRGAGSVFSSGLDLTFLREVSNGPMLDWDRPNLTIQIAEDVRAFPRIMIAQVHGYCLGGALGIMNCHDIVFAAEDAQLGMPESTARQLRPARHLDAAAFRPAGEEARLIALVGQATSPARRPTRSASSARRCRPTSSRRTRSHSRAISPAPPGAARAPQDHRADGPRPLALAGDPARSAGRRSGCAASWTRSATSKAISSRRRAAPIRTTSGRTSEPFACGTAAWCLPLHP